jgi:hypothetical protein
MSNEEKEEQFCAIFILTWDLGWWSSHFLEVLLVTV